MNTREAAKKVKFCLSRMREIEKIVAEIRLEKEAVRQGALGMPRSGRMGDPTSRLALGRLEPVREIILADGTLIRNPEGWIRVYREVCKFFSDTDGRKVLQYRFIERKSVERTLLEIGYLSRKTLFAIQDHMVYFALGIADGLGLLADEIYWVESEKISA